jgi:hypothetical protein
MNQLEARYRASVLELLRLIAGEVRDIGADLREKSSWAAPADIRDRRTIPRRRYRVLRAKLTDLETRNLTAAARRVFRTLQEKGEGTIASLAQTTGLNRRTVENATSVLRKAGLLQTIDNR